MEIFAEHILSWSIFAVLILYLIYTSIIVKEEKRTYLENAKKLNLNNQFRLLIPSWWKEIKISETNYQFVRLDQNYDWKAEIIIENFSQESNLLEKYAELLKKKKILLDEKHSIIQNTQQLKEKFKNITPDNILHIESMGTQDLEKRIYLSSYLIQINQNLIIANSLSSVLNGMLEGPYFEETIFRIKNY